jgi:UDP:flavonoid glycosyltransferase YjiC (YdhE family)
MRTLRGNVFTKSLPGNGYTRHNTYRKNIMKIVTAFLQPGLTAVFRIPVTFRMFWCSKHYLVQFPLQMIRTVLGINCTTARFLFSERSKTLPLHHTLLQPDHFSIRCQYIISIKAGHGRVYFLFGGVGLNPLRSLCRSPRFI